MPAFGLALHFIRREIKNRYLGSFSGGLWALLQPLIQLAVYSFVFVRIFKAPLPEGSTVGYVPFLFMGLWPWNAFAESLSRSCTSIQDNAALIGKVAMPREVFVVSAVAATFLIQILGFIAICIVLRLAGVPVNLLLLPLAILEYAQLFVFALGLALLLAAFQVFIRDFASALPQLLMLWMFASPVFYSRESLPERYRHWMDWNPLTHYTEFFRTILFGFGSISLVESLVSLVLALATLAIGLTVFRRLQSHFEDFL
jgi:lipopolysaccharide transport system permease protein